jgi:AcrR family transcriptional regulator
MAGHSDLNEGHQREGDFQRRLGDGLLRTAGLLGFNQITVDDVLERSGEPRARFYQHYSSKEDCFTAAYERVAGELTDRMLAAGRSGATWSEGIALALSELLDFVSSEPLLAAALIVEVRTVKSATVVHDEKLSLLASALESAREEPGARATVPPSAAPLIVGGVEGYLRQMLVRGKAEHAPEALAGFVFLVVLTYFGEEAAFEAMDDIRSA